MAYIFSWRDLPEPGVTYDMNSILEQSTNFRYRAAPIYTPIREELAGRTGARRCRTSPVRTLFKTGLFRHRAWRHHTQETNGVGDATAMTYTFNHRSPDVGDAVRRADREQGSHPREHRPLRAGSVDDQPADAQPRRPLRSSGGGRARARSGGRSLRRGAQLPRSGLRAVLERLLAAGRRRLRPVRQRQDRREGQRRQVRRLRAARPGARQRPGGDHGQHGQPRVERRRTATSSRRPSELGPLANVELRQPDRHDALLRRRAAA